jgi:hypothetical protein
MRRPFAEFLAYPIFMVVNGLAALELSVHLRHSTFANYIRVDSWLSIAVGLVILVWYRRIQSEGGAGDSSVHAKRTIFLVFFFVPWELGFVLLLIESSRLNYIGSANIHWGVLLQMFATLIVWITWECRLVARSWANI